MNEENLNISDQETEAPSAEPPRQSAFGAVFEVIETLALYFSIAIFILIALFTHSPVDGSSMNPTLEQSDLLIVRRFAYTPKNGDIIVCQSPSYSLEKPLVKRVIATAGQEVVIDCKSWSVTVDGEKLSEDYINFIAGQDMFQSYLGEKFTVPDNHIFVMGDNRNNSVDSRSSSVGFIDERYVIGKVWLRLWPISEFKLF